MSKVFRLYKGGRENVVDWDASTQHISESEINSIDDPAGDTARKQITSIPSPFARMDLVRTAFRYVVTKKQLEGNTIYHKIVSEVLDIAEIFLRADSFPDVEIIRWSSGITIAGNDINISQASDLGALVYSNNPKHRLLGETLRMFLIQDRKAYNFELLDSIYLLNYKKGPEPMNIIGGTSPATLFFSSANDDIRSYVSGIQFGEHKVFDDHYCPLFKRSPEFIKYFFALKESIPRFAFLFEDISRYLELTFRNLGFSEELQSEIREFNSDTYNDNYDDLSLGSNSGLKVEIIGGTLKGYRKQPPKSDFEIAATKPLNEPRPFVLPNEAYNVPLDYVNGKWKSDYRADYYDPRPLNARTLPRQQHITHPYLTVSDLLEPYIIWIPYPINKEKYFNGNFNENNFGYALPIKKELFKYFSIKDVMGVMPDGKKFFELVKHTGNAVEAILRIPIKNNKYIVFSRMYFPNELQDSIQQASEAENKGVILEYQFGLTIYPFLKSGSDAGADYRVMLVDRDTIDERTKSNKYEMAFYKESTPAERIDEPLIKTRTRSDKNEGNLATSIFQVVNKEFDLVEVRPNNFSKALIIPLLKKAGRGTSSFSFAIDFGTTNTHIEYKVDNGEPQPFDISESDMQTGTLHYNNTDTDELLKRASAVYGFGIDMLTELVPKELLPGRIGANSEFNFPIRTVISEDKRLQTTDTTFTLADFNAPFVYEKKIMPANSKITSNLKWANYLYSDLEKKRVKSFVENMVILIRNKIMLNNGNLDNTQIIWFYPSSMAVTRRDTLEETWNEYSRQYISEKVKIKKLSESIAPFYFLRNRRDILAYDKPVASIDIGGGTTDIVIYKDNKPSHLTSFRFAANTIFGDGYGSSMENNGFIKKYRPIINNILGSNSDVYDLREVMKQINDRNLSQELITYFFSLEGNRSVKKNKLDISFSKMLRDDDQSKVIFIFFYASVIYHLATLMKVLPSPPPRYITFSGTGSKIINIIDKNINLKNLEDYTNFIFSKVYGKDIIGIELKQTPDPKEITCKGGLFCDDFTDDIDMIKTVLVGDTENAVIKHPSLSGKFITYSGLNNNMLKESVVREVEQFIDKFFTWHDTFNYNSKFGALPAVFGEIKTKMKADLMNYLNAGIDEKLREVSDNRNINIEEPLFFYPLVGVINKIAQGVYTSSTAKSEP